MEELDKKYLSQVEKLSKEIQASEELAAYLEEEEEALYEEMKERFEPAISLIYTQVATENPLQLIALENRLIEPDFEGLYLPKILGYSVLRGELNVHYKYKRPQSHFKKVLLAICNSANFEILKKRIGQSIQVGFAFSSDIWITNLINQIENKRIRYFLQSQKLEKYRDAEHRRLGYLNYKQQFAHDNFQTAEFPETIGALKTMSSPLRNFLLYRVQLADADNSSILPRLDDFIHNKAFFNTEEHMEIVGIAAMFLVEDEKDRKEVAKIFNKVRKETPEFEEKWLNFLLQLQAMPEIEVDAEADRRISQLLDKKIKDELTPYYEVIDVLHEEGFRSDKAQKAIKVFYNKHEGLSTVNECVRQAVYQYFRRFMSDLEPADYPEFFELAKVFTIYIEIFANQAFNQQIKDLSMDYVKKKCLKHFTDKRGKDYQDIKKFVTATFQDLNFLTEKQVVELFKTRRKKRKTTA